jgi:3-oxoadipate enol-lactonase
MQALFVRTDSVPHHVRVTGRADAPAVVFANSLGSDLNIWHAVVERLGLAARSVRYDIRGHGLTQATPPPYSIAELARDLEQILEALEIRRAIVCGVSVGGMIALRLAASRPDLVDGLVLCDTGFRIGTRASWNQRISDVARGGLPAIADSIMARWFTHAFRTEQADQVAGYRDMLERTTTAGYAGVSAALRDADLEGEARAVACPTLVLCGDQDVATPPELGRSLAAAIRDARFELVQAAGHLPNIEQPDTVAARLRAFVRSHAYA